MICGAGPWPARVPWTRMVHRKLSSTEEKMAAWEAAAGRGPAPLFMQNIVFAKTK